MTTENSGKPATSPKGKNRPSLSKAERQRKIRAIQASIEAKKRELGMKAPSFLSLIHI